MGGERGQHGGARDAYPPLHFPHWPPTLGPHSQSFLPAYVVMGKEDAALLREEEAAAQAASPPSTSSILGLTLLSAGLGNSLSAICTNPFDIIKVRQQLQDQRVRASVWQVGSSMLKNEGIRSFSNGVTATCLRESTYSTIRMGTYETFRELYSPIIPTASFGNKLLAGMTSGAIGATVSTPTDLMKVRMQAARPTGRPPYPNTFVGFVRVYQEGTARAQGGGGVLGGIQSLWRGTAPNVVRAAILTASQLGCYDEAKGQFKKRLGMEEGIGLHLASSFVAGECGGARAYSIGGQRLIPSCAPLSRLCLLGMLSASGRDQGANHAGQVASPHWLAAFTCHAPAQRGPPGAVQGLCNVLDTARVPQCHLARPL